MADESNSIQHAAGARESSTAEVSRASDEFLEHLAWVRRAERAYAGNTQRAWRADCALFQSFCQSIGASFLPATAETVEAFIQACERAGRKPATVRRYLSTIALMHRASAVPSPCDTERVRLGMRAMARAQGTAQTQAEGLTRTHIERFLARAADSLADRRDKALLLVGYDTMARRSELVALTVEDVTFHRDGTGTALIRRSKTDPEAQGATAFLARDTVQYLKAWLRAANIRRGALFRRVLPDGSVPAEDRALHPNSIARVFRRVGDAVGLAAEVRVSGHSLRVGATQDLLALNIDMLAVCQSGRWKTPTMAIRYGAKQIAARGGIAQAARAQGRA